MENSTKALMIAGGVLLVILLISVGFAIFNSTSETVDASASRMSQDEITTFNNNFYKYEGIRAGADIKTLIGTIIIYNIKAENDQEEFKQISVNGAKESQELDQARKSINSKSKYEIKVETDQKTGLVNKILTKPILEETQTYAKTNSTPISTPNTTTTTKPSTPKVVEEKKVEETSSYKVASCTTHIWDNGVITKTPTCKETGEKVFTCKVCNERRTESLNKTQHIWDAGRVARAPTCKEIGEKIYTCTICNEKKSEAINKTQHVWDAGRVIRTPTLETNGEKVYTCTICNETRTESLDKLTSYIAEIKASRNGWEKLFDGGNKEGEVWDNLPNRYMDKF